MKTIALPPKYENRLMTVMTIPVLISPLNGRYLMIRKTTQINATSGRLMDIAIGKNLAGPTKSPMQIIIRKNVTV